MELELNVAAGVALCDAEAFSLPGFLAEWLGAKVASVAVAHTAIGQWAPGSVRQQWAA